MPTYDFKCLECGEVVEIEKPASEKYTPEHCGKLMKRLYTPLYIVS